MKNATKKIMEVFPFSEKQLVSNENTLLSDEALSNLTDTEQVFLRLAWFFENPDKENFNLESIYKHLDNEWLELALECIYFFFRKDTFLINNPKHSVIFDGAGYLNQREFVDFLNANGLNFNEAKLSTYIKRGNIPKADVVLSGKRFWEKSTCEKFMEKEKCNNNNAQVSDLTGN